MRGYHAPTNIWPQGNEWQEYTMRERSKHQVADPPTISPNAYLHRPIGRLSGSTLLSWVPNPLKFYRFPPRNVDNLDPMCRVRASSKRMEGTSRSGSASVWTWPESRSRSSTVRLGRSVEGRQLDTRVHQLTRSIPPVGMLAGRQSFPIASGMGDVNWLAHLSANPLTRDPSVAAPQHLHTIASPARPSLKVLAKRLCPLASFFKSQKHLAHAWTNRNCSSARQGLGLFQAESADETLFKPHERMARLEVRVRRKRDTCRSRRGGNWRCCITDASGRRAGGTGVWQGGGRHSSACTRRQTLAPGAQDF